MITLELPFPPRCLSPNSRLHWAKKVGPRRDYRTQCWAIGMEAIQKHGIMTEPVEAYVTFILPDKRRRDGDNLLASLKAGFDGLVDSRIIADDSASKLRLAGVTTEVVKGQRRVFVVLRTVLSPVALPRGADDVQDWMPVASRNAEGE